MRQGLKLCECGCERPTPIATRNRYGRGQIKGQPLRFISGHNNRVPPPARQGEESSRWLGDQASYYGIHVWLNKKHPKSGVCSECGEKKSRTEWAFLHHPAKHTRDIADYREMCRRCHRRLDDALMPRGAKHGMAKLSEAEVREIRELYASGQWSHRRLAGRFAVSRNHIGQIVRRRVWKEVV
jgi:hypothetical protein